MGVVARNHLPAVARQSATHQASRDRVRRETGSDAPAPSPGTGRGDAIRLSGGTLAQPKRRNVWTGTGRFSLPRITAWGIGCPPPVKYGKEARAHRGVPTEGEWHALDTHRSDVPRRRSPGLLRGDEQRAKPLVADTTGTPGTRPLHRAQLILATLRHRTHARLIRQRSRAALTASAPLCSAHCDRPRPQPSRLPPIARRAQIAPQRIVAGHNPVLARPD
jgi:hypothetical protein